jgi:hypothetical protein
MRSSYSDEFTAKVKRLDIMPSMDPATPGEPPARPPLHVTSRKDTDNDDKMICERCGKAEMYRMHAVWRCPECGFKTDCCGW